MKRGELYLVRKPANDQKAQRVFVVVSRQELIDSHFSTVICAPVFSSGEGLVTQVAIGPADGLKHPSWIFCDNLVSLRKSILTDFVGLLSSARLAELDVALRHALDLDQPLPAYPIQ